MKLSTRLQWIYDHLLPGHPVWDICCDHGLLGQAALFSDLFPEVHFVDQVPKVIADLETRFCGKRGAYFKPQAGEHLREVLHGSVVIAGVGAHSICEILQSLDSSGFLRAQRLILGPQRDEKKFIEMLAKAVPSFRLHYHEVVNERGRSRHLSVWEPLKKDNL